MKTIFEKSIEYHVFSTTGGFAFGGDHQE